ncbi:hypothetical protein ONV78_26310 [Hahella sp. CR1]|uniref:hypothetical protein n=1 Tax=Hahella sp. CR1 TaxID=2992807 RepID=UPI00244155FB|nr:hypothetical protein [Hahella sp. CR1]MDG9671275.1 hypothetical protein [Hahella sp. CR1]
MFKKVCGLVFVYLIFTGCTTVKHIPLSESQSQELKGKTVVTSNYKMPDFAAITAGKAVFGVVGAAATISAGNAIVAENEIPDPALAIKAGLIEKMKISRGVVVQEDSGVESSSDSLSDLVAEHSSSDYILDVKTFNWMFIYYPTDWAHYKITYSARMRLIDTYNKKIISETMCSSVQGDDNNPPTKDDLLNNKAELLKDYLSKASATCVDLLSSQVLML